MSELPIDDPRVTMTLEYLMRALRRFVGQPLEDSTLLAIRSLIEQTRTEFKVEYQYDFPPLVPLILPSSGFVAWYRQDLDDDEIRIKVLNLLRELTMAHLPVTAVELAHAMKLAWPSYQPPIEDFKKAAQVLLQ